MAEMLRIHEIIGYLDMTNAMTAAEFGCGSAGIAMELAKHLAKGRVYAIDIQAEKLSALEGKLAHSHIKNVVGIHGDLEAPGGSTLRDAMLDVVVIPNLLFQAEHKYGIIQEAWRITKPGGQLLVIDWLKTGPFSPKDGLVKPDEVKAWAEKTGFKIKKEFAAGDYHYGLLFIK